MNYRKVYMAIIAKAIKENRKKLSRDAENYAYYEAHHILPKSLFPAWKKRKSNIVLLTAREHFFCHQLLTKIWPGQKMSFALAAFLWGYNNSNKQGIQRVNKYKITSREYERIRQQLAEATSIMQKQKWNNKTQEELLEWSKKHSDSMLSRTPEERQKSLLKYRETLKNRTPEEWEAIRQKSKETKQNKTEAELLELHNKLSKNTKGKTWFNNGENEILSFDCPEGYSKGRIPNRESRIKAGITNKERNKTRGSAQSRMTEEQHKLWRQHLSETHRDGKEVYANMSDEVKKERAEKISKALKGKEHSEEFKKKVSEGIYKSPKHKAAVEKSAAKHRGKKFFNNGEICILAETCPEGFVPGMLKRQGNRKNLKEK